MCIYIYIYIYTYTHAYIHIVCTHTCLRLDRPHGRQHGQGEGDPADADLMLLVVIVIVSVYFGFFGCFSLIPWLIRLFDPADTDLAVAPGSWTQGLRREVARYTCVGIIRCVDYEHV